jgi:hypothetical protein
MSNKKKVVYLIKTNMQSVILDVTRSNKWKIKSDYVEKTKSRKRAIKMLAGGTGRSPIFWSQFFRPVNDNLKLILGAQTVGWLIDVMILFIEKTVLRSFKEFSPTNFKYVEDITIHLKNNKTKIFPRYQFSHTNFRNYMSYVFSVSFVQASNNAEAVCLLHITENSINIFFPFPHAKPKINYNGTIQSILRNIKNRHPEIFQANTQQQRWFNFAPNFADSNIWVVYYLLLVQTKSITEIEQLFRQTPPKLLQDTAFQTYYRIGQLISKCAEKAALKQQKYFAGPQGIFNLFFAATSKFPLTDMKGSLQKGRLQIINELFERCSPSNTTLFITFTSLIPKSKNVTVSWGPEKDIPPKWKRFVPVNSAKTMTVYF